MTSRVGGEKRCRILHMVPEDGIGGVEVAARSMALRDDLACDFFLLLIAGEPLVGNPRTHTTGYRSTLDPRAHVRAIRLALQLSPDVLVVSLWRSVPAAILIKLVRRRIRFAFFLHAELATHFFDAFFSRIAIGLADQVWGDSLVTLKARQLPSGKSQRVISFVTRRIVPSSDRDRVPRPSFVSWARLTRQKGTDRALHFIAGLRHRGHDARFDIWGPDGGEVTGLKRLAADLGLDHCVSFRGPARHEHLAEIAAEHSFFLQLSRFEGMAMGAVEAMQMGLVPVTTAVGQMAEYVLPRQTGIIVDPDSMDKGLAEIQELLRMPRDYSRLRANAIERWRSTPLYSDDVCQAAGELAFSGHA